jgi:hypothetical protein
VTEWRNFVWEWLTYILFHNQTVNRSLADRRRRFEILFKSGDFFKLDHKEKENVAPEVNSIRWVPLCECVKNCLTSMVDNPTVYVNKYQEVSAISDKITTPKSYMDAYLILKLSFQKLKNNKKRDPMFITAAALMELESFPDSCSLKKWCVEVDLATLTKQEQVLLFLQFRQNLFYLGRSAHLN